jgi:hypothetical protein
VRRAAASPGGAGFGGVVFGALGLAAPLAAVGLAALLALAGCSPTDGAAVTYPVGSVGPDKTVSPAVAQTRGQLVQALGGQNLILNDTQSPYRPPESASFASAPRAVYQVTLPADPNGGFVVVYEFNDTSTATAAAEELQAYLATGPGAVQSPLGTHHVIRQVGTTVVYYSWLPGSSKDPGAEAIQVALETLGTAFAVPG